MHVRRAFDQVLVLDDHKFYDVGIVGMDVKALRTQKPEAAERHLTNSLESFSWLVECVRSLDRAPLRQCREARDYEALDRLMLTHLMQRD